MTDKIEKTEQQWREQLGEHEYEILRNKGTERAFTGKYNNHKGEGTYVCGGCGTPLFSSATKYDSGSGWPSFYEALSDSESVELKEDNSHFMRRVEVVCSNCGGHLGHVFDDGPMPTGKRYCINSASLDFKEK